MLRDSMNARHVTAVACVMVAVAAAPAHATSPDRCALRGGRAVLTTPTARVLVRPKPSVEGQSVYACLRGRRPVFVGLQTVESSFDRFQLAGRWLAFRRSSSSSGGTGFGVGLFDLGRGAPVGLGTTTGPTGRFLLSSRGVVLVAAELGGGQYEVRVVSSGIRALDRGPISPDSLAISLDGATAYWTNNGQVRAAEIG
jgi:hypothetical protein